MVKAIRPDNLFQDMLEDDLIQIFKPIHIAQKWLGFRRVQVKYNFVTGASILWQLYAGAVIFINIICVADVVINRETVMKTKLSNESLKLGLILISIITDIVIWRNNFLNGNLNSMLYVKLQRLDRDLKMSNRRVLNRKLASFSLFLCIFIVVNAAAWIAVLNFVTVKRFYFTSIFAVCPSVGNFMEIILCSEMLLFLGKRIDYVNKLLQNTIKTNPKSLSDNKYSWSRIESQNDHCRVDIVLAMHNILDILFDIIKLFQFEILGFISQSISWIFITMRNIVHSIKEQTSVETDMIICNIPLIIFMASTITYISLIGEALTAKLERTRKLCINITSYCDGMYVIPILVGVGSVVVLATVIANCLWGKKSSKGKKKLVALVDPNTKYQFPLTEREEISHDTRRFRFGLPSKEHVLGLPIGQHIHLSAKIDDDLVIRAYTPVSSDDDKGYVDLVIKVYFKNVHPKFPEGGKMSQYLDNLKLGETIDVRGPSGRLQYSGNGVFLIKKLRKDPPLKVMSKKLNMIAGGTGITPMLQLVRHICQDANDHTEMRLLFANQSEQDILLRDELEKYQREYPAQFKVWYTVDRPSEGWQYSTGFINDVMIKEHMFPPADDVLVLMCGPPPMINFACNPALDKLGHKADLRFAY